VPATELHCHSTLTIVEWKRVKTAIMAKCLRISLVDKIST